MELHSGFKMLGNISGAGAYKCEGMINPSSAQDYVTKNYADITLSGMYLFLSGANANQAINVGSQNIKTTGYIEGGEISGSSLIITGKGIFGYGANPNSIAL